MPQVVKTDPRDAVLGPAQQAPEFLRQAERSSRLAVDTSVCRIPSCRSSSACLRLGRRSASTAKTGSVMVRCLLFLGGLKRSAPFLFQPVDHFRDRHGGRRGTQSKEDGQALRCRGCRCLSLLAAADRTDRLIAFSSAGPTRKRWIIRCAPRSSSSSRSRWVSSSRPISEAQADAHLRGGSIIVDWRDGADD